MFWARAILWSAIMTAFEFSTARSLVCAPGASAALAGRLEPLGIQRLFIVTDPGVRRLGLLDRTCASLSKAGIAHAIYDRVEADPPEHIVHAAVGAAKDF